jgi:hypothetical protein
MRFERDARQAYPTLRGRPWGSQGAGGFRYLVMVLVPFYNAWRRVTIRFGPGRDVPRVHVDGPGSPHRYADRSLCLWYPGDPIARRWRFADGLADLLDLVTVHLFKEAWWRETGEWLGEEAPHGPVQSGPRPAVAR